MAVRALLATLLAILFLVQVPLAPALVPLVAIDDCGSGSDSGWYNAARMEAPGECRGTVGGQLDGVDEIVFGVPARTRLEVRIAPDSTGQFSYCLDDPRGEFLGCGPSATVLKPGEKVLATQRAGDYRLRIWSATWSVPDTYTVTASLSELPPQDDCGTGADALMWPEHASPIAFPVDCGGGFTSDGLDTRDIFAYDPPDGMRVRVVATPLQPNATLGLCVDRAGAYWTWGCAAYAGPGMPSRLDYFPLAGTSYQTIVSGRPGVEYSLSMRADPIPAQADCGADGDAAPAAPGRAVAAPVACEGALLGGFHDWSDVYTFHAGAGEDVEVRLDTTALATLCLDSPAPGPVPCTTTAAGGILRQFASVEGNWTLTLSTKEEAVPYSLGIAPLPPAAPAQDDCGSGADAGGSEAAATPVADGAACAGALVLVASDLDDWYVFEATAGETLEVAFSAPTGGEAEGCLFAPDASVATVCAPAATLAGFPWRSVVERDGAWRLRVRAVEGEPAYAFHFSSAFEQDDCGSGRDAGAAHASAVPLQVPARGCAGHFAPNTRDEADWYRVPVEAGESLTAAVTAPALFDFDVCLYAPAATTPASCASSRTWQPEVASAMAGESGEWRVAVLKRSGSGEYGLSVEKTRLT